MLLRPHIIRAAVPSSFCCYCSSSRRVLSRMPLRARILNPAFLAQAKMSTQVPIPRELPEDEPDDVLFNSLYGIRTIELNRPKKLNSLNGSMARKIIPRLKEWEKSQLANVIIIKGRGDKAFCAGGDVAAVVRLSQQGQEGRDKARDFFALEYQLDHLIATYSKPYVAFMDGVTMGGGAGLSVHAPFRIATERTQFAMPEAEIGFFPDVGASFFLPRLDGQMGTYLALTSKSLDGVNAFYTGIATHYLHSSSLADLESRLAELTFRDYATLNDRYAIINATIEEFTSGLPHDKPFNPASAIRAAIDRCFSASSIEEIVAALKAETANAPTQQVAEWAADTLRTLRLRCPTSLRIALQELRLGATWSIDEAFQHEFLLAPKFIDHPDFVAGVTAKLITKTKEIPAWQGPAIDDEDADAVTKTTQALLDSFFAPDPAAMRLPLLGATNQAYRSYPHAWLTLPTEAEIAAVVRNPPRELLSPPKRIRTGLFSKKALASKGGAAPSGTSSPFSSSSPPPPPPPPSSSAGTDAAAGGGAAEQAAQPKPPKRLTRSKVVRWFVEQRHGKMGVVEKVDEVLARKTVVVGGGGAGDEDEDGAGGEGHEAHGSGGDDYGYSQGRAEGELVWVD